MSIGLQSSFRSISLNVLELLLNPGCALFTGAGNTDESGGSYPLLNSSYVAFIYARLRVPIGGGKKGDWKYSIPCLLANHSSNCIVFAITLVPRNFDPIDDTLNF
jgi:hypothetical protein